MSEVIEGQAEQVAEKPEEKKVYDDAERAAYADRIGKAVVFIKEAEREMNLALDTRSVVDMECFLLEFEAKIKAAAHAALAANEDVCRAHLKEIHENFPGMMDNLVNGLEKILTDAIAAKKEREAKAQAEAEAAK